MTPLEAARLLAANDLQDELWCAACGHMRHAPDCPVPMLPKIVAALEAARDLVDESPLQTDDVTWACGFCHGEQPDTPLTDDEPFPHDAECSWQALTRALKGEPA